MRKAKRIEIVDATVEDWYYEIKGLGCIFEVTEECKDAYSICIGGVSNCFIVGKEDVKVVEWDEWRPCETVEEKLLFIGKKVRREKDGTIIGRITGMYDDGFRLGSDGIIYADSRDLLEGYELLDGSPIGVNKLKELLE